MILHLGVVDVPYVQAPPKAGKIKRAVKAPTAGTVTTGDVAGFLEDKYGLFSGFASHCQGDIEEALLNAAAGTLENIMMGAPVPENLFLGADDVIKDRFTTFIDSMEAERIGLPGTPTDAALKGVNNRLKRKRGQRRPSFQDTGLMETSFKAWIE